MADEGIMALSQGMQDERPQGQQPTVTSADSYDAAQTALGRVNPGEQAALKEALRQNIGNLQLTPQQLDALIQVFEYVSQHPGDYVNLLQKMLEAGVLDEGDMPPEYDPEFIGAMLAVLHEMQQMQAAGAQEPMDLSPVVQGLQPMGMASGGLADIGQYLASKGRGGDSMLAHINPEEAAMLKRRGGSGTINPNTGLPEFKEGALGGIFDAIGGALKGVADVAKGLLKSPVGRILGTIALATVLGPAGLGLTMSGATAAGLAGAGVSVLGGGSMKEALISGAMGYIGGGGTVMGVNPVEAVGRYLPGAAGTGIGAAGGALNTGLATGLIGAGIGKLGGMSTEDALKMGLVSGVSAGGMKAFVGDPESYAIKSKMLKLAEAGDTTALALRDSGNLADMKAYIDAKASPFSTAQPNPVTAPAQSSPFPGVPPATNAEFPGVPPATNAEMASLAQRYPAAMSASGNAVPSPGSADIYSRLAPGELSNSPYQSSLRSIPAAPAAGPTGFFDKALTGAGNMYDKYLSPDRAGLPTDVSFFRKYGPLAAAGTAAVAAFGGMDSSPAEIDPITAGERARYEESRLRAKARRDRMANYGLEGNRPIAPLIYAADGGIVTARKVRHLYDGGDAAGYGYGEGEGAAQGSGMGGYGSLGEGYGDLGDYITASQTSNTTRGTPAFDSVMLDQANSPVVANAYNNAVMTRSQDQDGNMLGNLYGYQDAQQARDAFDSFAAEQGMRNEGGGRAKGGYIGRFSEGGDAGERRRLAQERRAGYGLEGNLLDTALDQARTGNAARPFEEYFGSVNNSGDQRGPGITNTGGIPGINIDPVALAAARVAGLFGSSVRLGTPATVDERSSYTPLAQAEADAVAARAAQAEANIAGSEGKGDFLGGSDSFGEGQYAKGGPAKMTRFPRRDGPINGPGTGTSDDIPAMLSDGEFVFTAKAVRNAGGGSRRKGAARMYKLMKKLEGGAVKGN
jgi:hypothetical protein